MGSDFHNYMVQCLGLRHLLFVCLISIYGFFHDAYLVPWMLYHMTIFFFFFVCELKKSEYLCASMDYGGPVGAIILFLRDSLV